MYKGSVLVVVVELDVCFFMIVSIDCSKSITADNLFTSVMAALMGLLAGNER